MQEIPNSRLRTPHFGHTTAEWTAPHRRHFLRAQIGLGTLACTCGIAAIALLSVTLPYQ